MMAAGLHATRGERRNAVPLSPLCGPLLFVADSRKETVFWGWCLSPLWVSLCVGVCCVLFRGVAWCEILCMMSMSFGGTGVLCCCSPRCSSSCSFVHTGWGGGGLKSAVLVACAHPLVPCMLSFSEWGSCPVVWVSGVPCLCGLCIVGVFSCRRCLVRRWCSLGFFFLVSQALWLCCVVVLEITFVCFLLWLVAGCCCGGSCLLFGVCVGVFCLVEVCQFVVLRCGKKENQCRCPRPFAHCQPIFCPSLSVAHSIRSLSHGQSTLVNRSPPLMRMHCLRHLPPADSTAAF